MTVANANNENTERRKNCCEVEGERCTCLPYNDYLMLLASCFAFVAFVLSWQWFVGFIVAFPGMVAFQTLWCCRQSPAFLYAFAFVAGVCSLINIGVGIYWNTSFGDYTWCTPWTLEGDTDNFEPEIPDDDIWGGSDDIFGSDDLVNLVFWNDLCFEGLFAVLSYVCGFLWGMSCIFTVCFVTSGRHAKKELGFHNSAVADPVVVVELPPVAEYEEAASTDFAVPIVVPTAVLEADHRSSS